MDFVVGGMTQDGQTQGRYGSDECEAQADPGCRPAIRDGYGRRGDCEESERGEGWAEGDQLTTTIIRYFKSRFWAMEFIHAMRLATEPRAIESGEWGVEYKEESQ